jgi:hypothetical protein
MPSLKWLKKAVDPAMFTWEERKHEESIQMHGMTYTKASALLHAETGYFYTFGYYYDSCSPGSDYERIERLDILGGGVGKRWTHRIPAVLSWLGRLKDELEAPDMWGELFSGKAPAIQNALTPPEIRFTQEQIGLFSAEFQRIEQRIDDLHKLTQSQKEAIHDGFEEIKAEMKRFDVKDWVQMATGLLFNIMVGSALPRQPPETCTTCFPLRLCLSWEWPRTSFNKWRPAPHSLLSLRNLTTTRSRMLAAIFTKCDQE